MFEQKKQEPLFPDFAKKKEEPKKEMKLEVPKLELKEIVEVVKEVKRAQTIHVCYCYHRRCQQGPFISVPDDHPRLHG